MKRRIGFVLLVTFALFAVWLLTPSSRAGGSGRGDQAKGDASQIGDGHATAVRRGRVGPETVGLPSTLDERAPFSASIATFVGGRNGTFNDVTLLGNFDGREDYAADRAAKFDDLGGLFIDPDATITRVALSEHTFANGFNENVVYYGDTQGNFIIGTDTNPTLNPGPAASVDTIRQVQIPILVSTGASGGFTLLNPSGADCTDDQVTISGIAVNPVADLGDFGLCGTIGEVVYVATLDTGACAANAAGQPFRTRIFAFAFTDIAGGVAPAGVLQVTRNVLSNTGIAVDDDGSLYFHLVDLIQFTGGAIFKATEIPHITAACPAVTRANRVVANIPAVGLTSFTPLSTSSVRLTNFSSASPGTAGTITAAFGNIVGIATGPGNIVYAAVARSFGSSDDTATQATEGPFPNNSALGATPSMIISFADSQGAFDVCSGQTNVANINIGGVIPVGDGYADGPSISTARVVGVNNFRVFALGNGPDTRPTPPATSPIVTASTLRLDMQIDFSTYAGITVDEEGTVYAISGGSPFRVATDPSPSRGEILAFQDQCPSDRRADFIDLRGNTFPGTNVGDGDSDRFDHIYWQAPNDGTANPSGISGLARGLLLYTNRTRNRNVATLANLPNGGVQGDDSTSGPLVFEDFDASHQVAGGDDATAPNRGDDADGNPSPLSANNPVVPPPGGGFEFIFGRNGANTSVWNAFFLNSNGNVTFSAGDTDNTPTVSEFYAGLPRIAPAWTDLNPSSRAVDPRTFPVQALGFANVNAFKVRYINVPEFSAETCTGAGGSRSNNISATLYDDGTGADENSVPGAVEGPTDLRFVREPITNTLAGAPPRPDGSGYFVFDYARTDLVAPVSQAVITGYSAGGGVGSNPPGLCETNLGEAARAADSGTFGTIQGQTASIAACLIGEGTEPSLFENFDEGAPAAVNGAGEFSFASPDFDLRGESNDNQLVTPVTQRDLNRGRIGFVGLARPPAATVSAVIPGPFVVAPNQPQFLIDALGPVDIFVVGSGFLPNESTTVCQGFDTGGVPLQRPGKTVATSLSLGIDNNGDSIIDVTIPLTNVVPMGPNLIKGTLATVTGLPGTAFPLTACGPNAVLSVNTTFTAGDNNAFGPFTSNGTSSTFSIGSRAPVVLTAVPTGGECSVSQTLAITGACFNQGNGAPNVTSVTAVSGGTVVTATSFTIVDSTHLMATFNLPPGSSGSVFRVFANGPNGSSRNLTTLPAGTPPGVPLGNEAGNAVTFSCAEAFQFNVANTHVTQACTFVPITVSRVNSSAGTATVDFATADGTALQRTDYSIALGTLTFAPGQTSKTINVLISDDSFVEPAETFTLSLSNPTGGPALGFQSSTTITINDNDVVGSLLPAPRIFVASLNGAQEVPATTSTATGTAVVILDPGDATAKVSMKFSGLSSAQTAAHIHGPAAPGVNAPIIFPLPNGTGTSFNFTNFNIALTPTQLQQLKDGLFYVNVHSTTNPGGEIRGQLLFNAIDDPATFVCMQYHDFLNREPDPAGLSFWINQITVCGADSDCITRRRTAVAAAFFFAPEFQDTGFYDIRLYRTAFDMTAATRPNFIEFMTDRSTLLGGGDLNAQKLAFANAFVTRTEFTTAYPASLTPAQYVDALNTNTGNSLTTAERDALVTGLTNMTETRATVLRTIADNTVFRQKEFNPAFVAMEYLGELRRNPDIGGFNFWLAQLTANNNNQAMVCSFLTSAEYQQRFGPNVTRTNSECAGVGP